MKFHFLNSICLLLFVVVQSKNASAQLSFPNGKELYLNTSTEMLYIETRVLFNTGKFKANDYNWEKIMDSLDSRWFVTACFNGDCKNDLLQSGTFIKDFGINDTTCFIAFHVETFEYSGSSKIIYHIYHKNNRLDSATVTYQINYLKPSGIDDLTSHNLNVYPNPADNKISIQSGTYLPNISIKIFNCLGKLVIEQSLNRLTDLDISNLEKGVYFLHILSSNQSITQPFIKQ